MPRPRIFSIRRSSLPGAAPGTLIPAADAAPPTIDVFIYSPDHCEELHDVDAESLLRLRDGRRTIWMNVSGLGDADSMRKISHAFGLHQLAMEDVMNLHQRPKVEEFQDHVFIIVRIVDAAVTGETEQVSIFLGRDFILTFQESSTDCFDPVRARLRDASSRIRNQGPGYLAYALIDSAIDGYFPLLETLGEQLEAIEQSVVEDPQPESVSSLHDLKRQLLSLRRSIWPFRELVGALSREEHSLIGAETRVYLRDCYDHTVQLMELIETYREISSGLMDVYISSASARLGEVMKVLTVIATIFIPLSFIASLYGMNFDRGASPWNMPELGWRMGYPFALAIMALSAALMILYFWIKGWLRHGGGLFAPRRRERRQ